MKSGRHRLRTVGIVVVGVALIVTTLVAFRTESYPDHPLGPTKITRRWGMVRRISTDFDRDGRVDIIGVYEWSFYEPGSNDSFTELYERVACDEGFDLWISYDPDGVARVLELDRDCDGVREKRMEGEDLSSEIVTILKSSRFRPAGWRYHEMNPTSEGAGPQQ